ncbi:AraC family transcriptional regulator [Anaerosporobacter faecicola]|uniref:AraC family transcriptional regulator n=1 Tax=Anaerosporobacter faecicola TaxID=2718714 RepID=UPI00143B5A9C|nr:AraC family transcriptional regulator [Anaerosporobacter faecicola]
MNLQEYLNLHENKNHGSYLLPIKLYHTKVPDIFTNLHWHEELEITLATHGKCMFRIDLKDFPVVEGDLVIMNPYVLHSCTPYKQETFTGETFVINMSMLDTIHDSCSIKFINPISDNKITFPTIIKPNMPGYQELKEYYLKATNTYMEKKKGFELELKGYLFLFLHTLFTNIPVEIPDPLNVDDAVTGKIKTILKYIRENYTEQLTVKDMAEQLNFSEYHFMRFFKKYLGVTCIEYINNYRLDVAARKLCTTNHSIMEVALETGFNNISYFNKLFKEKYKLTPKEFRISVSNQP